MKLINTIKLLSFWLAFGSMAFQIPVGWAADRFDRRSLLAIAGAVSLAFYALYAHEDATAPVGAQLVNRAHEFGLLVVVNVSRRSKQIAPEVLGVDAPLDVVHIELDTSHQIVFGAEGVFV